MLLSISLSSLANCPAAIATQDEVNSQGWTIHGQWPSIGNQFLYALASLQTGQKGEKVLLSCFYTSPSTTGSVFLSKFDETLLPRGAQWRCQTNYNFGTCTCNSTLVSNCPFN